MLMPSFLPFSHNSKQCAISMECLASVSNLLIIVFSTNSIYVWIDNDSKYVLTLILLHILCLFFCLTFEAVILEFV